MFSKLLPRKNAKCKDNTRQGAQNLSHRGNSPITEHEERKRRLHPPLRLRTTIKMKPVTRAVIWTQARTVLIIQDNESKIQKDHFNNRKSMAHSFRAKQSLLIFIYLYLFIYIFIIISRIK